MKAIFDQKNTKEKKAPFLSHSDFLQNRYQSKTYKLTVSGGRSCPTRDGSFGPKKGWGGCTFCDVRGSASHFAHARRESSITEQLTAARQGVQKRFRAEKFIAYFQSYTTTYEEINQACLRYQEALLMKDIVGIAIATRPDCLPDAFLEKIIPLVEKTDLYLELGIQTFHEETLDWFDRGHGARESIDVIKRIQKKALAYTPVRHGVDICAHIILGSPKETQKDIIRNAYILNDLRVGGVKIHNLHILKKTKLAAIFKKNPFPLWTLEEYLEKVALFLRHLSPSIAVHRVHGAASKKEELIGPLWSQGGAYPHQQLSMLMTRQNWSQGDLLPFIDTEKKQ